MRFDQRGFTLTEVLITCAIVGVLTTIGIPSYKRMVARSKKMEAKVYLGKLYATEQSFFGTYRAYGNNLYMMKFLGPTDRLLTYNIGFPNGAICARQSAFTPTLASSLGKSLNLMYADYYTTTTAPTDPNFAKGVTVATNGISHVCVSGLNTAKVGISYNYVLKNGFNAGGVVSSNSNVYSYLFPGQLVTGESNGFFATADGLVSPGDPVTAPAAQRDIWFIDHERTMVNIHDGIH